MGKFTNRQKRTIKQLILEAKLLRFSRQEALAFINGRLQVDNLTISMEHMDKAWAMIRRDGVKRMAELQGNREVYLNQYFERFDEVYKLQQEQWRIFHTHPDSPMIQGRCLQELHQLTVTLANLLDVAPAINSQAMEIPANETIIPKHQQEIPR